MLKVAITITALALTIAAQPAIAAAKFHPGPVFTDFGQIVDVDADLMPAKETVFKVLFVSGDGAKPGTISHTIDAAARFINMNVAAGVPLGQIHVAIVLRGGAGWDVTRNDVYQAHHGGSANGSAHAVEELVDHGVKIYVCGQSAAGMGIARTDLLPGVKLALSFMDASVLLEQKGYALVPF